MLVLCVIILLNQRILTVMNVFYAENNGLLGVPVFNASGPAYHIWKGVELAVSTFWPNYYQVMLSLSLSLFFSFSPSL